MKKVLSLILLTAILAHLIGFYVYFIVRQGQIRQEMREAIGTLPSQDFERFVFTIEEYKKVKVNDHEVKINDRMYDHSSPQFEGGKIILLARHDAAEDNLISFFNEVLETASEDRNPVPSQLLNFLSLTFIPQPVLTLSSLSVKKSRHYNHVATFKSLSSTVEPPPPRLS